MAVGSSFWSPSAPQRWEHCRPSSPSSMILFLCHLGLGQGVEHDCGSWFFVLVTLSPTDVGALSAQFTQLYSPVPPSADLRGLPRCWRVCQHRYHFFIFSLFILSTSYSTAGSLPVKEHSSLTTYGLFLATKGRIKGPIPCPERKNQRAYSLPEKEESIGLFLARKRKNQ